MNYGPDSRLLDVLRDPRGRAAIGRVLPHALALSHVDNLRTLPVCWFADREPAIIADRAKEQELWRELAAIEAGPAPLVEERVDVPAADYESGDVPEGSAAATVPPAGSRWS